MSGLRSFSARIGIIIAIVILLLGLSISYYAKIGPFQSPLTTTGVLGDYPISVNYAGSWTLVYWEINYGPQNNMINQTLGNLTGSGNYQTILTLSIVGEKTVCANATRLDSQGSISLTLTVLTSTKSTTASDPTALACGSLAV